MNYPGSKGQAGVFQRIIGNMPPHSIYVEAFAGSAQIFLRKRPAVHNVLIDADAGVIARLRACGRQTDPHAKAGATDQSNPSTSNTARVATRIICGSALEILQKLALPADAVVYCDPPYLLSTRQARFYYEHEFSDVQHIQLLELLQRMRCRVLLSSYPNEIYSSKLKSWRCCSYQTRTRGRTVIECLWCNFPEPVELHDAAHKPSGD